MKGIKTITSLEGAIVGPTAGDGLTGDVKGSNLERILATQMRLAGLPKPERGFLFAPPRKWAFDFAWPDYAMRNGVRAGIMAGSVAVEVEGGTWSGGRHVRGKGYEKDCEKYNRATSDGWKVFRFTERHVKSGYALKTIEAALKS